MKSIAFALTVCMAASVAAADVTVFENDKAGWDLAVGANPVTTIRFDDITVPEGTYTAIASDRYVGLPQGPTLTAGGESNAGLFIDNGTVLPDFTPVSGDNVFMPRPWPNVWGYLTVDFATPVRAVGAYFIDVEAGYGTTGIDIGGDATFEAAFSGNQGHASKKFLGIVSDTPFSSVMIRMNWPNSPPPANGIAIDDLQYSPVPVPGAVLLGAMGLGMVAWMKRRKDKAEA